MWGFRLPGGWTSGRTNSPGGSPPAPPAGHFLCSSGAKCRVAARSPLLSIPLKSSLSKLHKPLDIRSSLYPSCTVCSRLSTAGIAFNVGINVSFRDEDTSRGQRLLPAQPFSGGTRQPLVYQLRVCIPALLV